ncbi:MAG: hypothetical protein DI539_13565 [Flavobacterium psychrophilum]|nr:MAG: hypothetical protein DI539_13565 [Flavobacterium psychrophilum]
MSLLDDPKKNWVIPPFFLILWAICAFIHDYVRWNFHDFFWVVGLTMFMSAILSIIFSFINSVLMLWQMIFKKNKYHWFIVLMNLSTLLVIIYRSLFN